MTETYRIRSVETWIKARDDYLGGLSAEAVCRRYDLGLSAFRTRARRYGWRRVDQDDPAPDSCDLSIYDDMRPEDQVQMAWLHFSRALSQGEALEARRWRRLWAELVEARNRIDAEFVEGLSLEEVQEMRIRLSEEDEDDEQTALVLAMPPRPAETGPG